MINLIGLSSPQITMTIRLKSIMSAARVKNLMRVGRRSSIFISDKVCEPHWNSAQITSICKRGMEIKNNPAIVIVTIETYRL